jgi:hypothetical protein
MASSGASRSGLLTAGGILGTVGGAWEIWSGGLMMASAHHGYSFSLWGLTFYALQPGMRDYTTPIPFWPEGTILVEPSWFLIIGVPLVILGIVALVGGISAIRRRSFGLSLAGAICALPLAFLGWYLVFSGLAGVDFFPSLAVVICGLASVSLGILAVIFVALGKREFVTRGEQSGI